MLKTGINFLFATVQIMITNGGNVMTELSTNSQNWWMASSRVVRI